MLRGLGGGGGGGGQVIDDEPRQAPPPRKADVPATDWRAVVRDADSPAATPAPTAVSAPAPIATPTPARRAAAVVTPLTTQIPDASLVAERWDDLVAAMRAASKNVVATALEHASPAAVTAKGDLTVALDEANPIYERALEESRSDIAQVLRGWFPAVQRIVVRAAAASSAPPARLTDEMVRAERLSAMRRKDPVLDRAIDTLDLELAD